jgi:Peptidase family M1 domain
MSLFRIAECDYTRGVKLRPMSVRSGCCAVLFASCVLTLSGALCATESRDRDPHQLYAALNAVRVDPATVYRVAAENRISLHRGDATLQFDEGKLAFFTALDGQITGAVFSGRGHALAAPRDPVEKQQMGRFLGATVLDEDFATAYLRFTDQTAQELLGELRNATLAPESDMVLAAHWDEILAALNPQHTLRVLATQLSQNPKPYFYAALEGVVHGAFDVIYDQQRREAFVLGQPRNARGPAGGGVFYDAWVSYALPGDTTPQEPFQASHYALEASIGTNNTLEGTALIQVQAQTAGERLVVFGLARSLLADSITDEQGRALAFFQNEGLDIPSRAERGNDEIYVVLPKPAAATEQFSLRFRYRGNVITDAGNGVLVVGARDSWYPHLGDAADFATYDLTMRWPRKLQLVATGVKLDERVDGDFRVARWQTQKPVPVAGFNLGEYASATVAAGRYSVDVYANRELEQSLNSRLASLPPDGGSIFGLGRLSAAERPALSGGAFAHAPPPSPADTLRQLGKEIESSIRFYETFSGPFPFPSLSVSQIPGNFGQGWPGLLYLSTYAYLSPEAQRQAGLSASGQEHFTELMPYHEVAHQWWGNVVGWSSYRDQWINESIASYLALLFADSRRPADHLMRLWLERFRHSLLVKPENGERAPAAETGALTLGARLDSSRTPHDYDVVVYSKGAWVLHMIREMLRQPAAKNPDARFTAFLQTLSSKYAYRALSTEDLQKELEAVMTPAMDLEGGRSMEWFFDEWIRGTGIPRYHVEFTARSSERGILVHGTLTQTGVPRSFIAPVPIYARLDAGHTVLLGTVVAEGAKTTFHFVTPTPPRKLLIDPEMTLLCETE